LDHILNDKDFDNIRDNQGFIEIIRTLEQKVKDSNVSNCPFRRWNRQGRCGLFSNERCKKRKLWWLHRKSMNYLSSMDKNDILKGKECLLEMLEFCPNHVIALYNLACAESLLGNVDDSLKTLEKSIEFGYQDLEHIVNDKDFINIRNTPRFAEIISSLQQKLNQSVHVEKSEKSEEKNSEKSEEKDSQNIKQILIEMGIDLPDDVVEELLKLYGSIEDVVSKIFS